MILTQQLISYEQGELDEQQTIQLFQQLYDSGLAWSLQGHYGRTCYDLLQAGLLDDGKATEQSEGAMTE